MVPSGQEYRQILKTKLTQIAEKAAQRLQRRSQGPLPSQPVPNLPRGGDESWLSARQHRGIPANTDNRAPRRHRRGGSLCSLEAGSAFPGAPSCSGRLCSVTSENGGGVCCILACARPHVDSHLNRTDGLQGLRNGSCDDLPCNGSGTGSGWQQSKHNQTPLAAMIS
jgi:hypothetical protein